MKNEIVRELSPELADKIINAFKKKQYDEKVSQEAVLHHLKQLKATVGKLKKRYDRESEVLDYDVAMIDVMLIIDKKIAKIKGE